MAVHLRHRHALPLLLAEAGLRLACVVAAVAALWLLLGANGLGLVSAYGRPGATSDAASVINERATLLGTSGLASVAAANGRLGPLEERSTNAAARPDGDRGPDLAEVSGPTEVSVSFWGPSRLQRWAWVLVRALPTAAVGACVWLLADVCRSARRGDPFTARNVSRLTWITVLVGVSGVLGDWGASLVRLWLLQTSDVASAVQVDASLSFGFVIVMVVLAVVTQVWRRGVAMRSDLEGLV